MTSTLNLRTLAFQGADDLVSSLAFEDGLNLVWGASNTGKSFALRAIDFMLGAKNLTPRIRELSQYDSVLLSIDSAHESPVLLRRSIKGGPFEVSEGAEALALRASGSPGLTEAGYRRRLLCFCSRPL